ncbi:NACHT and TPR domain protein [Aspergillus desertorum]
MVAPADRFLAIYEKASEKYHEITGETLQVQFLTKICSVSGLTEEIDEQNRAFREFREKRQSLFNALNAALIPVQLLADLAAGGASMVAPPSSLVFGAVLHLVGAAKGVSASYEAIQGLMQMLQDFTVRLNVYIQEAISEALSDKLSDIIITLVEILALSSKTIRRGRLLKFTRNILLGNDDAIQAAMVRFDKLTRVEASLVGAETLTESKRAGRVVDGISVTVNATNATVLETGMAVNQMSARVHDVQEMLAKLTVSANKEQQDAPEDQEALSELISQVLRPSKINTAQEWLDKIRRARVPGTGDWVHGEEVFRSWINKETPVIFMSGNPGVGKSFLMANMVCYLHEQFPPAGVQHDAPISIGFFFFKDDNLQTRSFHQALRDLAFQLSKSDPGYSKWLGSIEDYEQISTLESAWHLLFAEYFLRKSDIEGTAYILLDAVDEALDEQRRIFLDLAKDLYSSQSRLQLAIVGRPYISDQLFESLETKVPTLHVTKQKNSGDISQYIHTSINKSLVLRRVSAKLRGEIVGKLSAGAEGMFLWVNLMLQELIKRRNESSMRKALEQAPRGLKEMLRHVLATFSAGGSSNEEELEYLNETLLWVTCAHQPWSLAELETILRLKSPEGDGMIDLEGALRRQWASFFTLHREDGLTTAELEKGSAYLDMFDSDQLTDEERQNESGNLEEDYLIAFNSKKNTTTVTFCHASIGDFFRDESEGKVSATCDHTSVGVNYHEAKAHILKTYLMLITEPEFATKANDAGHMLRHAVLHWEDLLLTISPSECPLEDGREIAKLLLTLFRSEEAMSNWLAGDRHDLSMAPIKAVSQWWRDQGIQEFLSPDEKEFISTTENEPVQLLKPMAMLCIKRWLYEDLPRPAPMVSIVWRYQRLLEGVEIDDNGRDIPAEEVVEAAELSGSEKTSRWFRQCGIALSGFGHSNEALHYLNKALEADPDDWRTLRELAQTYRYSDWQRSIEFWELTRSNLVAAINAESPENSHLKAHLHDCLEQMKGIYEEQENRGKQFEMAQEAYLYAPSCWTCLCGVLQHHNDIHAYGETMDVLRKLADARAPDEDRSELTKFFLATVFDVHDKSILAAEAALATNNLGFVLESLQTAARAARAESRTLIAAEVDMAIARIYDDVLHDRPRAIRCWEKIIDTYSASPSGTLIGVLTQLAVSNLAQAFLCDAVEAGVGTPEAEEPVARLEKLVRENQSYLSGDCTSVPAVYLGIYWRLRGQDEQARALFRPSLQQSIQNLHDDNPANEELSGLRHILMRTGDLKNVVALVHRAEPDDSDSWYRCRGPCRLKVPTRNGFAICPICLEEVCPDCVGRLEDMMPRKRCYSQHAKYLISIPPRSKEVRSGMMLLDSEEMKFETWLNRLRKEWALRVDDPAVDSAAGARYVVRVKEVDEGVEVVFSDGLLTGLILRSGLMSRISDEEDDAWVDSEENPGYHSIGACAGYCTVPQEMQKGDEYEATAFTAAGRRGIMIRRHDPHRVKAYVFCNPL